MPKPTPGQHNWGDQLNAFLDEKQNVATRDADNAADINNESSASRAALSTAFARRAEIHVDTYPRLGGETDDSPRIARALAAGVAAQIKRIRFGGGTYTINSTLTITDTEVIFEGVGIETVLENGTNVTIIDAQGIGFQLRDLQVQVTDTARTNYPVKISGARPFVGNCYFDGVAGARRSGIYFTAGSMGTVTDCVFNHSCIRIETWDVKIDRTYVWSMSCDFGIGIFNGAGNVTIANVDVVPPLTSNANGIAGILVDGASGNPFNVKMSNVYLDGNPSLDTRQGIYIGDGAGAILMENINANRMDSDCIVIDSAFNVVLNGYSGHTNNEQGRGAREIVVKKTGTQSVEKVRLSNIQCLRTTAVTGTAGYAIEVESTVGDGEVVIDSFDIKQPGGGGGYATPEVKVPVSGGYPTQGMSGRGQLGKFSAVGSQAVAAGATSATINLSTPYGMAYRPRPGQISIQFEGTPSERYRIQYISDNQIFIPFSAALAAAGTIHWRVDLRL